MKYLFHFSTVERQFEMYDYEWENIEKFAEKHQMDGVEIMIHNNYDITRIPSKFAHGMHLKFYPMWLDFWRGDKEALKETVGNDEDVKNLYGGLDRSSIVEKYKEEYEIAKYLGVKYMVFHVSHVRNEDTFRWEYDYTDKDVMDATIELVNEVFPSDEEGPLLLFENLWWPGLTYCDPELTKWFIEQINYKNKGYLLDTSHLILTNPEIGDEKQAVEYMRQIVKDLGETSSYIKAMHVNKALPKYYMQEDHSYHLERYKNSKTPDRKRGVLMRHIGNLDVHKPFDHPAIKDLIDDIKPEFCVFEVTPKDRHELAHFLNLQNKALGRL